MEAHALRLFFGLPLPMDLREQLGRWQRTHPGIEGWCRAQGLHLTLAFLGSRPPEALPSLEVLAEALAARHRPLALRTAPLGSFSRKPTTRLLWLGLEPSAALSDLVADLRSALGAAGEAFDPKPFSAHVTLGRFRQAQPLAAFAQPPALTFATERLVLFESLPQGGYGELRSWPLRRV